MTTVANVQSRIAGLAESDQLISGVAIAPGDVTRGLSGDRKVWRTDHLRAAASTLEGTPINALHSQQVVGEVTRAGFDPERGVIYEARLEDESLADQVANGQLEVSIEAKHADGGTVEAGDGEAMLATDIQFTGMAMVQHGAAPSASAQPGEAAALSPESIRDALESDDPAEAAAILADVNGTEVDLTPPDAVVNAAEAALDAKDRLAEDIGDCGTGVGEDRAETIVNGELTPADFTTGGDHETAIPDYLDSHSEDVEGIDEPPTQWSDETWTDGCGPVQYALWGGTATGTGREWAQSTADAVEAAMEDDDMAKHQREDADMQDVPDEYIFDNPGEAVAKAEEMGVGEGEDLAGDELIHTHGEGEDTVFMPGPTHEDLLEMLEEMDALAEAHLKGVGPVEFTEADTGELDESAIPNDEYEGHYLNAGDTKSASSFPLVDADGILRRGNVEAAWDLRGQGDLGMPRDAAERVLRELAEEFGEPGTEANPLPEDAYEDANMAKGETGDGTMERAQNLINTLLDAGMDQADIASEVDRDPSTISAIVTGDIESPPASLIDALEDIDVPEDAEAAAGATDDPETGEVSAGGEPETSNDSETIRYNAHMSETEEELRARLSEKDDEIAELQNRVEQLEAERADVARAYAEALAAGDTVFDEDTLVENFDVAELRETFDQTETATMAEAEPDVQSGDEADDGDKEATLAGDAIERIEAIETKLDHAEAALPASRVDDLREEAADLAGTDSYEAALEAI